MTPPVPHALSFSLALSFCYDIPISSPVELEHSMQIGGGDRARHRVALGQRSNSSSQLLPWVVHRAGDRATSSFAQAPRPCSTASGRTPCSFAQVPAALRRRACGRALHVHAGVRGPAPAGARAPSRSVQPDVSLLHRLLSFTA
jgi:hypothetical protein